MHCHVIVLSWQSAHVSGNHGRRRTHCVITCGIFDVPQVLLTPPGEQSPDAAAPYAAAQRWLDGFMESTVNAPLPAAVTNGSDAEAARVAGVPWVLPKPRAPAGTHGRTQPWLQWHCIRPHSRGLCCQRSTHHTLVDKLCAQYSQADLPQHARAWLM